jgi:protein-S-isoprenylcysteine O-methyltransferase Ste14
MMNPDRVIISTWCDNRVSDLTAHWAEENAKPRAHAHRRFRWRGAIAGILLVPATFVSLFSFPLLKTGSWAQFALHAMAWATFLAGAALRFWSAIYLGGRKERELVSDGPYSIVRHPLYLGSVLLGASAALFLESPLVLAALLIVVVVLGATTVRIEEGVLRSRHGDSAYDDYSARVAALVPSWRTFYTPRRITLDVNALRLEAARASRWVWIPLLGEALSLLRTQPWWPHLFRLF